MVRRRSFSIDDREVAVLDRIVTMAKGPGLPPKVRDFLGSELENAGLGRYGKVYTRSRVVRAVLSKLEEMLNAQE